MCYSIHFKAAEFFLHCPLNEVNPITLSLAFLLFLRKPVEQLVATLCVCSLSCSNPTGHREAEKNQQFDMVSMALVPCYETQTVGTSNALYFRRSVFTVRLLAQVVCALTGDP